MGSITSLASVIRNRLASTESNIVKIEAINSLTNLGFQDQLQVSVQVSSNAPSYCEVNSTTAAHLLSLVFSGSTDSYANHDEQEWRDLSQSCCLHDADEMPICHPTRWVTEDSEHWTRYWVQDIRCQTHEECSRKTRSQESAAVCTFWCVENTFFSNKNFTIIWDLKMIKVIAYLLEHQYSWISEIQFLVKWELETPCRASAPSACLKEPPTGRFCMELDLMETWSNWVKSIPADRKCQNTSLSDSTPSWGTNTTTLLRYYYKLYIFSAKQQFIITASSTWSLLTVSFYSLVGISSRRTESKPETKFYANPLVAKAPSVTS